MQKPYLGLARANGGSSDVGLRAKGLASVTLNGTALESLPGWAGAGRNVGAPAKDAMLPAGVYHVTQDLLLAGLDRDAAGVPCLMEKTERDLTLKQLVANSGKDIIATLGVRMALRDRLGYRHFERQTAPLKFRYDAAQWEKDLPQLPVESCSVLEERRALAEKAAARARAEERYAASDLTLSDRDNPLYEDMCADDLEPLRRRLAAGTPPYLLSGKLEECGIRRPRPELFALVMPVLHARASQSTEYCDVVRALHGTRSIPLLEQLEAMNLPLYCEGERRSDWRGGIQPFDANGSPVLDPPAEDTLRWLQLLVKADVPVCDPVPGEGSLLNRFGAVGSPPLIELLLKAGCDPRFKPAVRSSWGSAHPVPFSPQVMWAIRRFIHKPYENLVLPVGAARFTTLNRLMGEPGAAELNAPDPETGRAFLHDYTGRRHRQPGSPGVSRLPRPAPGCSRACGRGHARSQLVRAGLPRVGQQQPGRETDARPSHPRAAAPAHHAARLERGFAGCADERGGQFLRGGPRPLPVWTRRDPLQIAALRSRPAGAEATPAESITR